MARARHLPVGAAVCALLTVAGCGAEPAPQPFDVPAAAAPTSVVLTPAEEELFGPRVELPGGLIVKELGKVAQWGGPDDAGSDTFGVRVVVDSITVDPKCDRGTPEPTRGHRLLVSLRAETGAVYDEGRDSGPHYYNWSTIGADGVSEGASSSNWNCHEGTALPYGLRPSAKYRGEVTLETANPAGQLVLADFAVWKYPTG